MGIVTNYLTLSEQLFIRGVVLNHSIKNQEITMFDLFEDHKFSALAMSAPDPDTDTSSDDDDSTTTKTGN